MSDSRSTEPAGVDSTASVGSDDVTTDRDGTSARPARREHRPSTIIWGLVIAVIGTGVLARALGAEFDNDLALIVLLGAAGVALLLASIFSAVARR